jgi:hypothetical protein
MEKIPQPWRREYRPLKLFKEDIEEIVKIITVDPAEADIHIEIDEFRLDNPKELNEIKKDIINELYIGVEVSTLQLILGRKSAHLWVGDKDNTGLMGIAIRIDEILRKRQRFLGYLAVGIRSYLVSFFLGCTTGVFFAFTQRSHTPLFVLLPITFLITWVASTAYIGYIRYHFSTIHTSYSYGKSNFFKRNKDAIFLMILSSVATLVVTLLVQWIIKKL